MLIFEADEKTEAPLPKDLCSAEHHIKRDEDPCSQNQQNQQTTELEQIKQWKKAQKSIQCINENMRKKRKNLINDVCFQQEPIH